MHAELYLRDLTAALAAKDPPITQRGIPVAPVYAGIISNALAATLTGYLILTGNNSSCVLNLTGSMAPLSFVIGAWDGGGFPWTVTVPKGAASQVYQQHIDVTQASVLVGRFVISVVVLDLDPAKDTDDLLKPPNTRGAITFLQISPDDSVTV